MRVVLLHKRPLVGLPRGMGPLLFGDRVPHLTLVQLVGVAPTAVTLLTLGLGLEEDWQREPSLLVLLVWIDIAAALVAVA